MAIDGMVLVDKRYSGWLYSYPADLVIPHWYIEGAWWIWLWTNIPWGGPWSPHWHNSQWSLQSKSCSCFN